MTVVYYLILVLHVLACLFLIGVVLLQQGKSQDLASAFGGGGSQTAFGPRGSANLLSKATTILAGVFMLTSLSLTVLRPQGSSILDQPAPVETASPAAGAPAGPAVPGASSAPATTMAPGATLPAAPAAPAESPAVQ